MSRSLVLALAAVLIAPAAGKTVPISDATLKTRACQAPYDTFPFCDTALPLAQRVEDLITRFKGDEIPPQLTARHNGGGSPGPQSNVSRLGLPTFDFGMNGVHGVQSSCVFAPAITTESDVSSGVSGAAGTLYCPTSFPNPVNFGATFNDSLALEMGAIIGVETRALWLAGATEESEWSGRNVIGPVVWSPNINLAREPRWGRNQEVPSEDPMVNGRYGTAYTIGVQAGVDRSYVQAIVTLKHDFAYSLEDSDGFTRHNFDAVIANGTLADVYFPAFKAAITNPTSPALGMMCSVNGIPSCANAGFQSSVVRGAWNFSGYISSDTGAIEDFYIPIGHHYVKSSGEAACAALRGGTDVCSGTPFVESLMSAVSAGLCSMSDVLSALRHTFTLKFSLGLFDPPSSTPYWSTPISAVGTAASLDSSARAARSSMVLLKNAGPTLPLAAGLRLAVIGPHTNATDGLVGNYLGQLCADDTTNCVQTPLAALAAANAGGSTRSAAGCAINSSDTSGIAAAVALAAASDAVVLMLGIDDSVESESHDRLSIDLPHTQHLLAAAVAATGKPVVVVLLNGGCVDVTAEMASPIGAILAAGYPGVYGARAIADTLFGANDQCCGKLSTTWYPAAYTAQIAMSEMEWDVSPGRSYRYYADEPVFPFGFGMALTSFAMANASAAMADGAPGPVAFHTAQLDERASVRVNVTNTGAVTGDEVVFLYAWPAPAAAAAPAAPLPLIKTLLDYQRVHLAPGASQVVQFDVAARALARAERASGHRVLAAGALDFELTTGAPGVAPVRLPVTVRGGDAVVERFPVWHE